MAASALVAVPEPAGSSAPSSARQINSASLLAVTIPLSAGSTATTIPPIDTASRSAGWLGPGSTFLEPGSRRVPTGAHRRRPARAPAPGVYDKNYWRFDSNISWYGPGFHRVGHACGQAYTKTILGVAHRTLPCGTLVTFRNPANGRQVTVPVIDRGPSSPAASGTCRAGLCDSSTTAIPARSSGAGAVARLDRPISFEPGNQRLTRGVWCPSRRRRACRSLRARPVPDREPRLPRRCLTLRRRVRRFSAEPGGSRAVGSWPFVAVARDKSAAQRGGCPRPPARGHHGRRLHQPGIASRRRALDLMDDDGRIYTPGAPAGETQPLVPPVDVRDVGATGAAAIRDAIATAGLDQEEPGGGGIAADTGTTVFTALVDGNMVVNRFVAAGPGGPGPALPVAPWCPAPRTIRRAPRSRSSPASPTRPRPGARPAPARRHTSRPVTACSRRPRPATTPRRADSPRHRGR